MVSEKWVRHLTVDGLSFVKKVNVRVNMGCWMRRFVPKVQRLAFIWDTASSDMLFDTNKCIIFCLVIQNRFLSLVLLTLGNIRAFYVSVSHARS